MQQLAIGIDIGGTNTKIGYVDKLGRCLATGHISTTKYPLVDEFVKALSVEIEAIQSQIKEEYQLVGIGIGAPNGNFYKGTIEFAPNLSWKGIVPLADLVKAYYDVPVYLTNDANAAAIGEMIYGGAKGMKDFIVITLGTGLGSGIVSNGQLVYGHDGFAGEIGHTIVNYNGRFCGCGRRGCLETYVSATGIRRTVYKLLADYTYESSLRDVSFNELSAEMITEAAKKGDKIAIEAFEYTGRILGMKLADSVAHTSPEAIFLFGGLTNADDFIFNPTIRHMESNLLAIFKNKVKVLPSGITGNAAVLGASALVWKELGLN